MRLLFGLDEQIYLGVCNRLAFLKNRKDVDRPWKSLTEALNRVCVDIPAHVDPLHMVNPFVVVSILIEWVISTHFVSIDGSSRNNVLSDMRHKCDPIHVRNGYSDYFTLPFYRTPDRGFTSRPTPTPMPPVGGMPCSRASRKSSSSGWASSSPARLASICARKRSR